MGWGVFGQNKSTTGDGIGVRGYSASNTGEGVEGQSPWIGVQGRGTGVYGIGVIGQASSSSGTTYGVIGGVSSASGFSGYFNGGKFYVGGNTGIGTESPSAKLHVFYNSTMDLPQLLLDEDGADYARLMFKNSDAPTKNWTIAGATSSTDANSKLNFYYSALGDIVSISGDGKVGIRTNAPAFTLEVNGTAGKAGGGSWSTSSDIRLKNILGNYSKGLNEISALQPIVFTYKEGNYRNLPSDQEQVGFVAQEVQKVFPEAVNEGKDGYLDFNIHSINVAMVNAIKELKAENNRLKAENEQQQSKIETIESRLSKLESLLEATSNK